MNRLLPWTAVSVIFLSGVVLGDQIRVDNTDPNCSASGNPFCTIQRAMNAASPGDKIRIMAGLYEESLLIDKDDLTLACEPDAILDGIQSPRESVVTIAANRVKIHGCEIRNGDEGIQASLVTVEKVVIKNCDIHHNNNEGVEIRGADSLLKNNQLHHNAIGIGLVDGTNNRLIGNHAHNNAEFGLFVEDELGSEVRGNSVENNEAGIAVFSTVNSHFSDNSVKDSTLCGFCLQEVIDCTFEDNRSNNNLEGFLLMSVAGCRLEDNEADQNSNFGFVDDSIGLGTAGTANTYDGNDCQNNGLGDSSPTGLCEF